MSAIMEERIQFGEKGVYLHGLLHRGQSDSPGIVLNAPHPNFGGTMDFYLLADMVREFSKRRYTTLRFNYRGVSPSTGTYGGGTGEADDTLKAVEFIRKQRNVNRERIALIGYSFGGSLVLSVAERANAKAIVSISPQVNPFETKLDITDYARRITSPVLLVHGKADDTVPYLDSERIFKSLENSKEKAIELIEGANHIYTGKGRIVVSLVTSFLDQHL
jgi:alpha/beta superfamily hydrolase